MNRLLSLRENFIASWIATNPPVGAMSRKVTIQEDVVTYLVQVAIGLTMLFCMLIAFFLAMFLAVLIAPGKHVFALGVLFWMLFGVAVLRLYSRLAAKGFDVVMNYFDLKWERNVAERALFYKRTPYRVQ